MARKTDVQAVSVSSTEWVKIETPKDAVAMSITGDGAVKLTISFDGGTTGYPLNDANYHFQKKLNGIQVFYLKADTTGDAYILFDREV